MQSIIEIGFSNLTPSRKFFKYISPRSGNCVNNKFRVAQSVMKNLREEWMGLLDPKEFSS